MKNYYLLYQHFIEFTPQFGGNKKSSTTCGQIAEKLISYKKLVVKDKKEK